MWIHDLRFAFRSLARHPRLHLLIVVVLGLGMGASIAVVDLTSLMAWRRLPVPEANRVVKIFTAHEQGFVGPFGGTSFPDYLEYRQAAGSFSGLAAWRASELVVDGGETTDLKQGAAVSDNYFQVLSLAVRRGRGLDVADGREGAEKVVVVSHGFWQILGAEDSVIGRILRIDGHPFEIVGVAPPGFTGTTAGLPIDFYFSATQLKTLLPEPQAGILQDRQAQGFDLLGRLSPGKSRPQAQAELATLAAGLDEDHPLAGELKRRMTVTEGLMTHPVDLQRMELSLGLLGAAVGLLLLITCANVAHLLTAQAMTRQREMAIRKSMGAGRGRLLGQLLSESFLLALAGGLLGLVFARAARIYLAIFAGAEMAAEMRFDARVLGTTFLICLGVTFLFGLAPAWIGTRTEPAVVLKGGTGDKRGRRFAGAEGLAGLQIGLCVVLLTAGALLAQSLRHRLQADLGFRDDNLCIAALDLSHSDYSREQGLAFFDRLATRAGALPGVEQVGSALIVPPLLFEISLNYHLPDQPTHSRKSRINYVDEGYFETMGIDLEQGRNFNSGDTADSRAVMVINRQVAEELWPGESPLGRVIELESRRAGDPHTGYTVIGVVGDVSQRRTALAGGEPVLYFSTSQRYRSRRNWVLRSDADPAVVLDSLRALVREMDPSLALTDPRTGGENRERAFTFERMQTTAVGLFGGLGFLLAMVGIFAAMSYAVNLRIREIGIRMAVGARPTDIRGRILRRGMWIAGLGAGVGLLAAAMGRRLLDNLLFGITSVDLAWLMAVPLMVIAVAALATFLPARRAAGLDPLKALRHE